MTQQELQQAYEKQTAELELYKKIVEAQSSFIFIFDSDFILCDVIMSSSAQLLHTREELIGTDGRMIYSPEVSELYIENIKECLLENKKREIEYPLQSEGLVYYFKARLVPLDNGKVMAIIRDITDRMMQFSELHQAKIASEEAGKAKTVFLSNMSHEIRTPLNAIVGFSELLTDSDNEEEKVIYKDLIKKNTAQLLQLVNEVLDLSRMESGKMEMNFAEHSLTELLIETHMVHSLKIPSGIELKLELPEENIMVMTDRNRFLQVMSNFVSNAIKNTTEGSITLKLESDGEWARASVIDTGRGIPKDHIKTIFDRFEKVNDFVPGAGLGLSICKSIVDQLGGKIDVESEEGVGSTFSVSLREHVDFIRQRSAGERPRILISKDNDVDCDDITKVLSEDYEVLWAENKEEVMDKLYYLKPDLLVLDIAFGGEATSLDLVSYVRTEAFNIPIIVTIEQLQYALQQKARHAGCRRILSKPYAPGQLKALADIYLKRDY